MGGPRKPSLPGEAGRSAEPDRDLFLEALERLEVVPDKDLSPEGKAGGRRVQRRPPDKRLTEAPAAILDLHGKRAEEAFEALDRFVQQSRLEGERTALVITGKGLRSPGGVAVLKETLERWVRNEGAGNLDAYSEAPRALGGRGAYVLYLRR